MPLVKLNKRLEELDAQLEIVTLALLCDGDSRRNVLMAKRRGLLAEASRIGKMLQRIDVDLPQSVGTQPTSKLELVRESSKLASAIQ